MMTEKDWLYAYSKWWAIVEYLAEVTKIPYKDRDHDAIEDKLYKLMARDCSYCDEFDNNCHTSWWEEADGSEVGKQCPLEVAMACTQYGYGGGEQMRYWRFCEAYENRRYANAHTHAREVLYAIVDSKEEMTGHAYVRGNEG